MTTEKELRLKKLKMARKDVNSILKRMISNGSPLSSINMEMHDERDVEMITLTSEYLRKINIKISKLEKEI
jgi:hypothetical protein